MTDRPPQRSPAQVARDVRRRALARKAAEYGRAFDEDETRDLLDLLRMWSRDWYGTVEGLVAEVCERTGLTRSHVRNALIYPKSARVIDAALAVFREATGEGSPVPAPEPEAEEEAEAAPAAA